MRLSILIFCLLQGTCWTSIYSCMYQPKTLHVKEGESVTIPCSYTYPEDRRGKSRVIITWGEGDGINCNNIKKNIVDHSGNITADEYKERISTVHHPGNRTASITIRGLKAEDGTTFCCRVTILTPGNKPFPWNHISGTALIFPDGRSVTQMEELMAVPGEDVIIPCHYPQETLREALQVFWNAGYSDQCDFNEKIYTWSSADTYDGFSLVNFPADVSLRIHHVQRSDSRRYCCLVTTRNGQLIQSQYSTELSIAGPPASSSPFTVTQLYNITSRRGESVILTCSYSRYKESDVLGVNIYWRLGNITGPYVYHPYKEMVHPSYRGRTEITGPTDLHIRGVQMSDDSTYYCFVMIKLCSGSAEYGKIIKYGNGTHLILTDPSHLPLPVIIPSISAAVLLVLLCVILVILKKTGVICKKKDVPDVTFDNPDYVEFAAEGRPYSEMSSKEDIHYSELNKAKLSERNPTSNQNEEIQTVYTAVAHPDSRK